MKFTLTIQVPRSHPTLGLGPAEIAMPLRRVARDLEVRGEVEIGTHEGRIRDAEGNTIGKWEWSTDEDDPKLQPRDPLNEPLPESRELGAIEGWHVPRWARPKDGERATVFCRDDGRAKVLASSTVLEVGRPWNLFVDGNAKRRGSYATAEAAMRGAERHLR